MHLRLEDAVHEQENRNSGEHVLGALDHPALLPPSQRLLVAAVAGEAGEVRGQRASPLPALLSGHIPPDSSPFSLPPSLSLSRRQLAAMLGST